MEDGEASITLGSETFQIPKLAIRQNRKVVPALTALSGVSLTAQSIGEDFDRLLEPIYWAITKARPDFNREQLEDLEVTDLQIVDALQVVMRQSGFFSSAKTQADAAPGEALATA